MKKKMMIIFSIIISLLLGFGTYSLISHINETKKEKEQQRLIEEYYNNKLDSYIKENSNYDDYEVDIAFLGDSLTDGYNVEYYFPEYVVSNRGIGGETTHGLLERLDVSVLELKPKVVVMLIGGNNLDTMFEDYEEILISFNENLKESKIVLVSLTAMGKDWKHKNELACLNNVKIEILAKKYGYSYVDIFTPLYDISTNEIYEVYTTDGAHFTQDGYELVTSYIKPVVDQLLVCNE